MSTVAQVTDDKRGRRMLTRIAVWAVVILLVMRCVTLLGGQHVGGKWVIVTEHGWLPEAGGSFPMLHRETLLGTRKVDELPYDTHYLGDDCVIYIAYSSDRRELMAACGNNKPIRLSGKGSGVDWLGKHSPLTADPMVIDTAGITISRAEIKRRAGAR
jgi:hypothetical protein